MPSTPNVHTPLHLKENCHVTPTSKRKRLSAKIGCHTPKAFVNESLLINNSMQENAAASKQARKRVEKRRSLALQNSPSQSRAPAEDTTGELKLSNEQLVNHYKNCMKLSTENKINSKNAFNLHLIDHMGDMLKERCSGASLNFMEAGGTIFAGAKIYASRVDVVHSDAYRVLNSLGMHSGEKEDGEDGTQSENNQDKAETTRRRKKRSNILESNRNNICAKDIEINAPSDMLNIADISSADGQLINNVVKISDGVTLFFHSAAKPKWTQNVFAKLPEKNAPETASEKEDTETKDNQSVQDECGFMFWKMLNQTKLDEKPNIFDWDVSNTPLPNESEDSQSGGDVTMTNQTPTFNDDMIDEIPDDFGDIDDNSSHSHSSVPNAPEEDVLNCTIGVDTRNIANITMSEYSYFKSNPLSLANGPSHWKLKTQRKPAGKTNTGVPNENGVIEGSKKKRKVFILDFNGNCNCSDFPQSKSLKSKESKEKWKRPSEEKLCQFAATDEILDKMKANWSHLNIKPFNALSKKFVEPTDLETEGYNYDNVHDANNFCPADTYAEPDNYDGDDRGGFDLGATMFEATSFPDFSQVTQQTNYMEMLKSDENLIHQPKRVKQIDIAYAKKAKRIDVRKLKSAMWKCLETDEQEEPVTAANSTVQEQNKDVTLDTSKESEKSSPAVSDTNKSTGPEVHADSFTDLYSLLPQLLPSKMNENLSIPLAFTCLLHLANEKKLKLGGNDEMSEVAIAIDNEI